MDKKRCIITPTFKGHFEFIKLYLRSFEKFLKDREFPLYFIISKKEETQFNKLIKPFLKKLNLNVIFIDDIFKKYKIPYTPDEFLGKYGSYSFQTLKKFYGALYIDMDQFLLLDSESMLIKPTNMNELFDNFFKAPRFWVSYLNDRRKDYPNSPAYKGTISHCNLLNMEPKFYCIESFEWFYEKRILTDLLNEFGSPLEIVMNIQKFSANKTEPVLEAFLYYQYIIKNHKKYNYNLLIVQDELKKFLGENGYKHYLSRFEASDWWFCGVLEEFMANIDKVTESGFRKLIDHHKMSIIRSDADECSQRSYFGGITTTLFGLKIFLF